MTNIAFNPFPDFVRAAGKGAYDLSWLAVRAVRQERRPYLGCVVYVNGPFTHSILCILIEGASSDVHVPK